MLKMGFKKTYILTTLGLFQLPHQQFISCSAKEVQPAKDSIKFLIKESGVLSAEYRASAIIDGCDGKPVLSSHDTAQEIYRSFRLCRACNWAFSNNQKIFLTIKDNLSSSGTAKFSNWLKRDFNFSIDAFQSKT